MHSPERFAINPRRQGLRTIALGAVGMALALAAAFLLHDKLSPGLWHDGQWAAAVATAQ